MKTSVLPHQISTSRAQSCVCLKRADVVDQLLGEILLGLALLDVRTVEPLDVLLIEDGRHRLDGFELVADCVEQRRLEHARGPRRRVAVLLEDVPAAEHDVVERRADRTARECAASGLRCACRGGWCRARSAIRSAAPASCEWRARRRSRSCSPRRARRAECPVCRPPARCSIGVFTGGDHIKRIGVRLRHGGPLTEVHSRGSLTGGTAFDRGIRRRGFADRSMSIEPRSGPTAMNFQRAPDRTLVGTRVRNPLP